MKYVYNRSQYVRVIERASEQKGSDYYEEAGFVDQLLCTLVKENLSTLSSGGFIILGCEEDEGTTSIEFFYDDVDGNCDYMELSKSSLLELHGNWKPTEGSRTPHNG